MKMIGRNLISPSVITTTAFPLKTTIMRLYGIYFNLSTFTFWTMLMNFIINCNTTNITSFPESGIGHCQLISRGVKKSFHKILLIRKKQKNELPTIFQFWPIFTFPNIRFPSKEEEVKQ